uniref:Candidate secreted effector n=1 Tax=Meloidogyne incognita TaxID=6306 RepID=A0A914MEU6_MELIC
MMTFRKIFEVGPVVAAAIIVVAVIVAILVVINLTECQCIKWAPCCCRPCCCGCTGYGRKMKKFRRSVPQINKKTPKCSDKNSTNSTDISDKINKRSCCCCNCCNCCCCRPCCCCCRPCCCSCCSPCCCGGKFFYSKFFKFYYLESHYKWSPCCCQPCCCGCVGYGRRKMKCRRGIKDGCKDRISS